MRISWWRSLLQRVAGHSECRRPHRARTPLCIEYLEDRLVPSTVNVWTDATQTGNWNDADNWALGHVPVLGETAQFTGSGKHGNDAAVIAGVTPAIDAIDIAPGYTGTITDNSALVLSNSMGSGDFTQAGGTFTVASAATISVAGTTAVNGGTLVVDGALTGTVTVSAGTLAGTGNVGGNLTIAGTLSPGTAAAAGTLTVAGNVTLAPGSTLIEKLTGPNAANPVAGTDYDQVSVVGSVTLDNPTLSGSRFTGYVPATGAAFTIIDSTGLAGVSGTFGGMPEGSTVNVGGVPLQITYAADAGNAVQLTAQAPATVYVDSAWAGTAGGADPSTDPIGGLVFGYNAFAAINPALNEVAADGTVVVYGGTYNAALDVTKPLTAIQTAMNALDSATSIPVTINGAVTIGTDTTFAMTTAGLSFGSTIDDATAGTDTLTITGSPTVTFAGVIGGSPLAALDDQAGTTDIDTTSIATSGDQTYSGSTVLGADVTLSTTGAGAIALGDIDGGFGLTVDTAGITTFGGATALASLTTDAAGTTDLNANITTSGSLIFNNPVALGASATLTAQTGTVSLAGATLGLGGNTLTIDNSDAASAITGQITGSGSLTKLGAGTLTLSSANSYQGGTTIGGGTLQVSADDNLGSATGGLTIDAGMLAVTAGFTSARGVTLGNSSATIRVAPAQTLTLTGIVGGAGSLTLTGGGTLDLSGTNTFGGSSQAVVVDASTLQVSADAGLGNAANLIELNGGTLQATGSFTTSRSFTLSGTATVDTNGNNVTLASPGVISGSGSLTKAGAGTLTLAGANTYGGGTTVNGGTLAVSANNNLGTGSLTINAATLEATGSFTASRSITLGNSASAIQVDSGQTLTVATGIGGTGGLTVSGSGTLSLSAANTYSGATNINAGTLRITGSLSNLPSSDVNLNGAVTLDGAGAGQVGRPVIVTGSGSGAAITDISVQTATTTVDGITVQSSATNVTVISTTVTGNRNGIVANPFTSLSLAGDAVTGNSANGIVLGAGFSGSVLVVNATVAGNGAVGIAVGGGSLSLQFDTVAYNMAGGLSNSGLATVQSQDSLFADNTGFDYQGPLTSQGNNLIQTTPGTSTHLAASDLPNQAALLAPLGNYGGLTQTIALLPGSAALGAGAPLATVPTDQRGVVRPSAAATHPDIGAFQSQGFNVTAANPSPAGTSRTLIGQLFLQNDGKTPLSFQATVKSNAVGEPVVGGRILFSTTTGAGGDSATTNVGFVVQSVNTKTNAITFVAPPSAPSLPLQFSNGEEVIYDDGGGTNKPIGGLVEGGTYFAIVSSGSSTSIQLSATANGPAISLTSAGTGANQTIVPAVTAAGSASTLVSANATASPAAGTTYQLNASAGGTNGPASWNLYNQYVKALAFNVPGGNAAQFQPQNAQSGVGADNPAGGGILFTAGGAATPTFTVTLMDQETTPAPVVVSGQTVSLQAVYDKTIAGFINSVSGPNGVQLTTGLISNTATTTTTAGVATFTNLQIYQSVFNSATTPGYQLKASFTNPAANKTVAVSMSPTAFSILPYQLVVTAGNFAGYLQKAFDIVIASSSRGDIRLLDITEGMGGLQTNQVMVEAFDYAVNSKGVAAPTPSTTYNGPVTLSASANNLPITLLYNNHPYTGTAFTMTNGLVKVSNITPQTTIGTFNLFADTTTLPGDPGGLVDVSSKMNAQSGVFIRIDMGRQRGR